jgi:hypothetical protein
MINTLEERARNLRTLAVQLQRDNPTTWTPQAISKSTTKAMVDLLKKELYQKETQYATAGLNR